MSTSNHLTSRPALFVYGAIVFVAAVIVTAMFVSPLLSTKKQFAEYNVDSDNVALHGYDTVAYFTEGQPMKGSAEFEKVWQDARWQFASATNRDLFTANPDRYAPQYGGYCSGGLATGEFADVDPEVWTIVDGKLYLNTTEELRDAWRKAPEAYVVYANYNWENNRGELRDNY
ncbi:MAG: YHS domain-containing (seleno)protein [Alphaproteobacteria bacterium]|nr:YHS domain-containing (seleno)protein [Alphaproteobacteria bacterium]